MLGCNGDCRTALGHKSGAKIQTLFETAKENAEKVATDNDCASFLLAIQKNVLPLHPIMQAHTDYIEDAIYGQRLLISVNADPRELQVQR